MSLMAFFQSTVRLFYRLTVGLTVLLLQSGLLFLIVVLTLTTWVTLVGVVTWKTYTTATDHHLGWSALACVMTAVVFGGLVVVTHRVAKDWLGLTTLSLSELVRLALLRRRPRGKAARPDHGDGDSRQSPSGRSAAAAVEARSGPAGTQQVKVVRKVQYGAGDGGSSSTTTTTSSVKMRTTTITGQRHN